MKPKNIKASCTGGVDTKKITSLAWNTDPFEASFAITILTDVGPDAQVTVEYSLTDPTPFSVGYDNATGLRGSGLGILDPGMVWRPTNLVAVTAAMIAADPTAAVDVLTDAPATAMRLTVHSPGNHAASAAVEIVQAGRY